MEAGGNMTTNRKAITLYQVWRWFYLKWRTIEWPLLAIAWLTAVILGCIGFARYAESLGEPRSFWDLIYRTNQLFSGYGGTLDPPLPVELDIARFLAPIVTVFAVWKATARLYSERLRILSLRLTHDHIIICGLSRKGWLLAREYLKRGDRVVVIEKDEHSDLAKACRDLDAIVIAGDAMNPETLQKAAVTRAGRVIAVTADDGVNAEIAVRVEALMIKNRTRRARNHPLICTVHLVDPQLCELARVREMRLDPSAPFRLELFNVFDSGARLLWDEYKPIAMPPATRLRLLVVGLGRLGENLIVQAARDVYTRVTEPSSPAPASRCVSRSSIARQPKSVFRSSSVTPSSNRCVNSPRSR